MEQIILPLVIAVISSGLTGVFSAVATTKALNVHIDYLGKGLEANRVSTSRAHLRIDNIIVTKGVITK